MAGKLLFVAALAVAATSFGQASLERYVESVATGKAGVQQACFVQSALKDALIRYHGEVVVDELNHDLTQIKEQSSEGLKKLSLDNCYKFRPCERDGKFSRQRLTTWRDLTETQCFVWVRFQRVCKLIRERKSVDEQMQAVENWVCQVSDDQRVIGEDKCTMSTIEKGQEQAESDFYDVVLYDEATLERAKRELVEMLASEKEAKNPYEAGLRLEAQQVIRKRVAEHFEAYQSCWSNIEAKEAEEAAKEAQSVGKKKGNFLRKMFRCTGSSCSQ